MIHWLEQHLFPCLSVKYLGIECPGCGMQRAFIALLKGHLYEAWQYNPALFPFLLTILLLIFHLKFDFKHGARLIVMGFVLTTSAILIQYGVKQFRKHQMVQNQAEMPLCSDFKKEKHVF